MNGVSREKLLEQREQIRELRGRHPKMALLQGAELNIAPDGSLDYDEAFVASSTGASPASTRISTSMARSRPSASSPRWRTRRSMPSRSSPIATIDSSGVPLFAFRLASPSDAAQKCHVSYDEFPRHTEDPKEPAFD